MRGLDPRPGNSGRCWFRLVTFQLYFTMLSPWLQDSEAGSGCCKKTPARSFTENNCKRSPNERHVHRSSRSVGGSEHPELFLVLIPYNLCFLRELICFACKRNLDAQLRQNNTTGKSPKTCPDLLLKIFRFRCRANQWFDSARLTR